MSIADIATKYFNKNKVLISKNELSSLYEASLEDIAAKYKSEGLDWLHKNRPELYAGIEKAEDELNKVWNQCLKNKASLEDFQKALLEWERLQLKGIEFYTKAKEGGEKG